MWHYFDHEDLAVEKEHGATTPTLEQQPQWERTLGFDVAVGLNRTNRRSLGD